MSNYKNFIQDFPVRCGEILKDYKSQAKKNGREVTHMLSIAAAALPVPFERLRKPTGGSNTHRETKKGTKVQMESLPTYATNSLFPQSCGKTRSGVGR